MKVRAVSPFAAIARDRWRELGGGAAGLAYEELAGAFDGTGVPVQVTDDVVSALWFKLLVIAGIGGVTAYCRCPIGTVRQEEALHRLVTGRTIGSAADEHALLGDVAAVMRDASICGLGQTASSAIESALRQPGLVAL